MTGWHLKVIFCLLTSPKFHFGDVEKAMFEVVANHWGLIYFLLNNRKCDLGEVEKAMFQGVPFHFELIFGLLANPNATWVMSKK